MTMTPRAWIAAVLLTGCATRGYVEETVKGQRTDIDQRLTRVEAQTGTLAERIGWSEGKVVDGTQRLTAINTRVEVAAASVEQTTKTAKAAEETAAGATARADTATARVDGVNARMTTLFGTRGPLTVVSTSEIRFRPGKADVPADALTTGLTKEMNANPSLIVELKGYTDTTGTLEQNILLSQRRADAVKRLLVQQGVNQARIYAIGLGPLLDPKVSPAEKRRVSVRAVTFGQ